MIPYFIYLYPEDATKCWRFNGSSWSSMPGTKQRYCFIDAVQSHTPQGWWISGEVQTRDPDGGRGTCSNWTSEIFYKDQWNDGPIYPGADTASSFCSVQLNSTHTMFVGKRVWIYDSSTDSWTETEPLTAPRQSTACLQTSGGGVLVFGGYAYNASLGGPLYAVDRYNPETRSWSKEPDLPRNIIGSDPVWMQILGQGNGVTYFLVRRQSKIYQRSEKDGQWSVLQGVNLPEAFGGYNLKYGTDKAFMVPDNFVTCV